MIGIRNIKNSDAVGSLKSNIGIDLTANLGKGYIFRFGTLVIRTLVIIHACMNSCLFNQIAAIINNITFAVHDGDRTSTETDNLFR